MSRVAADLERVVRDHPTQWFNFYRFWGPPGRDGRDDGAPM
jgi:predicted LPLAT superfamily acyltransferase